MSTSTQDAMAEIEVFETRQEALDFIEDYYQNEQNHWFCVKERADVYKQAGKMFREQLGGHITTRTITGYEIKIPIMRFSNGPFWGEVAPKAHSEGKFKTSWEGLSEDDLKGILKVRSEFTPSLHYTTCFEMVDTIRARPEGRIRKDDFVFSVIHSVRWGYDPPVKYSGMSNTRKIKQRLAQALRLWDGSEQGISLSRQVERAADDRAKNNGMRIRRVVGIALGTMTEDSSVYQHAMVLSLAEQFGVRDIYMQDPAYTTADKRTLHQRGVTITTEDRIFNHIYSDTIVVCIAPVFPALELMYDKIASFKDWPAMLIWERVFWDNWAYDRCTPRAHSMIQKYDVLELEKPLNRNVFLESTVYVRRRDEEFSGMNNRDDD
ncbi:hypothetical protein PspLS_01536 [Pyricularia sp. CBS 133598]|nr:hypothetical protein PspLS_01536 [Pyricularia sp. CBS 133598]